ncbi:MAG: signal peptidase II [Planctomycetota bacterium]
MSDDSADRSRRTRFAFAAVVLLSATLDLWSKSEAFSRLGPAAAGHPQEIVTGVLRFETALNPGIAWSLLSEKNARWVIASFSLSALPLIFGCFLRQKSPRWPTTLALAFIAGGTIGNLHDRIACGAVRDFIHFYCFNFPIFNLADAFICVGAAWFVLEQWRGPKPAHAPLPAKA